MNSTHYYANRKQARERQLSRCAAMRAAKERKRMEHPPEHEPKLVRWFPLEFCVRDKRTGQVSAWHDLRSARHLARQAALLLRFCQ